MWPVETQQGASARARACVSVKLHHERPPSVLLFTHPLTTFEDGSSFIHRMWHESTRHQTRVEGHTARERAFTATVLYQTLVPLMCKHLKNERKSCYFNQETPGEFHLHRLNNWCNLSMSFSVPIVPLLNRFKWANVDYLVAMPKLNSITCIVLRTLPHSAHPACLQPFFCAWY